jgi:hypothetical protein
LGQLRWRTDLGKNKTVALLDARTKTTVNRGQVGIIDPAARPRKSRLNEKLQELKIKS